MVANKIRPPGFPPHQNNQNNFNRGNNFNQNRGGNFNQGQLHRPQVNQPPAYQAPIPQTQRVSQTNFESYVKANDAILRNIQSQGQKLEGITTRSGVAYQGPTIPTQSKVVKQGTEVTKDQVQTPSSQSTAPVQPPVAQPETQTPVSEPVVAPVSAPMRNVKSSIPYPLRRDNERRRDQANEQIEKFYEIFKDMSFEISFTDALILMPKFASTLKALIGNKEKLSEMARTSMNEHYLAVILNKLPRKLRDPDKFLIPCEFPRMDECLALADLGASINLMPFSVWEALLLSELTPTCMTLELADRSVSKPIGIAKDVSFKVGVFYFPADFVVVDFEPDSRVPLILGRCFLKTGRALIDVHKGELTLYFGNEAITYNLDQTVRYSANYNQMTTNKIDVIEMACEEYSQEVLSFSDVTTSGNLTPHDDPIVSTTSPTITPFGDSDFLLFEEADAFLGLEDDPNSPRINPFYYDPEEEILLLEAILNSEPLPPLLNHEQYLPSFKKELKGDNKFPVIIAKELGDEEKSVLIKVLKSHKRAITWKLSDIQGINPKFCTHKILMEEDYKPAVQHQRRVNPKIHDVIKKEVKKLLDTGLIYRSPIVHGVNLTMEVFMDDFSVFGNSFENCLSRLEKMLQRCEDTNLSLNWEKSHFMVKEGAVLGQRHEKHFKPIHYASKTMNDAESNYTTTEKEMLALVYAFEKFRSYLIINKSIVYTDHSALKYLFAKKDAKVEAKALPTNDARVVCKFLKSLFSRYGAPRAIISDCGTYFCNDQFAKVMLKYRVTYRLSTAYHPQISGQVEVSNRGLKRILERTIGENRASWSDKLDDVLWAFRTTYKTPIGCTPYKLVYGKACHLPIELEHKAYLALKQGNFYLAVVGDYQKVQLNELNELCDHAYENSLIYKEKTKRIHESKIKNCVFNVGDRVLLFNSRLKIFSGKLKTRWSGPFTITKVFPYGTVELSQANGPNFKVNGHRVKHYFGGDVP
nr:reverse transcriptase domain-containing protein [Tanacetum cinerariifolium]